MSQIDPNSFLADFFEEASELVDSVEKDVLRLATASSSERSGLLEGVLRDLHTLKGNSGMMGLAELQERVHQLEDEVGEVDPEIQPTVDHLLAGVDEVRDLLTATRERGGEADTPPDLGSGGSRSRLTSSVRISFTPLDALVDRLMEVVIFRNRLAEVVARGLREAGSSEGLQRWREASRSEAALAKILEQLRSEVMALRMVPLDGVLERLRRIVHDESQARHRQVELRVEGGETPVDKALLELASEALGHLVRNAVIHGIEDPESRKKLGKPEVGRLEIAARVQSEELVIRVEDDGGGIDLAALRRRATAQGQLPEGPHSLFDVVFLPGVSSQSATDLGAGRGMGLAAVQEAVKRQGGHIEVDSQPGVGTRFDLYLPLVVSITRALLLAADGEQYALPVGAALETLTLSPGQRHEIQEAGVLRWRGRTLPLLDLGIHFGTRREPRQEGHIVVLEVAERLRGLVVDELLGLREIVVKSLDAEVVGRPLGILGSTVLGDGRAVLILDPPGLMEARVTREGKEARG